MKYIHYTLFAVLIFAAGCKKESNGPPGCDQTVPGIAGAYKLTKVLGLQGSAQTDITNTIDNCQLNALLELKANKIVEYIEYDGCGGSGTGTWDIVDGRIYVTAGPYNFQSFAINYSCSSLSVTEPSAGGAVFINVFSRQ
ncbi:MAG: hypothetical protein QM791_04895 [Ferruginibacter sp.]